MDTQAEVSAWLDGKPISFPKSPGANEPHTADVDLREGKSALLIRVMHSGKGASQSALVTTFVADRPISFSDEEASGKAR